MKFKVGDRVLVIDPAYYNGQLLNRVGKVQKIKSTFSGDEYLVVFAYTEKKVMPVWLLLGEFRLLTKLEKALT